MSDRDGPTDDERREHARKYGRRSVPVVVVQGTDEPDTQVDPDVVRRLRAEVAKIKRQLRVAKVVLAVAGPVAGLAGYALRELRDALIERIERVENDVRQHHHQDRGN